MIYFTTIYGERYLPFLQVCLESLKAIPGSQACVAWSEISELELELLRAGFPGFCFTESTQLATDSGNVHMRISQKLRFWGTFLVTQNDGEIICFLDADTIVMKSLDGALPDERDFLFTWKVERFVLNTGVIIVRNTPVVRDFINRWLLETERILADPQLLEEACRTFGGGDQRALANLLAVNDYTSPFEREFDGQAVRFFPAPCSQFNQTNSTPVIDETYVYHLKSGWHGILLENAPYSKWRSEGDCFDLHRYWDNLQSEFLFRTWKDYVHQSCLKHRHHFPAIEGHVERGILNSEMNAVISLVHSLGIDAVIESGRYLGHSTQVLAQGLSDTDCILHSTELVRDEIARQAEERLRGFSNIKLHYGDAAEVIPEILKTLSGKKVAILLDGPKGKEAFEVFSRAIAEYPNVILGFIHDLRKSWPGMVNPNRDLVYEWFERIFFTDDEEYVEEFRDMDDSCRNRGLWEPYNILWKRTGSYGPTLGAILPTFRDRYRAQQRAHSDGLEELGPAFDESASKPSTSSALKKLHRIPGYATARHVAKKLAPNKKSNAVVLQDASNEEARLSLFERVGARARDIIIDCGANVGQEVEQFVSSGAMIYAFEPNPFAFQVLSSRFNSHPNVVCFPMAVLDREDTIKLYLHENSKSDEVKWSIGSSILDIKGNVDAERFVEVPTIDLSEFIARLVHPLKLLKMDIEGAEYETLTRIVQRGLASQIEHIIVETHAKKIPQLQEREDNLKRLIQEFGITNIDLSWI